MFKDEIPLHEFVEVRLAKTTCSPSHMQLCCCNTACTDASTVEAETERAPPIFGAAPTYCWLQPQQPCAHSCLTAVLLCAIRYRSYQNRCQR